jgi:hypothetical protein
LSLFLSSILSGLHCSAIQAILILGLFLPCVGSYFLTIILLSSPSLPMFNFPCSLISTSSFVPYFPPPPYPGGSPSSFISSIIPLYQCSYPSPSFLFFYYVLVATGCSSNMPGSFTLPIDQSPPTTLPYTG